MAASTPLGPLAGEHAELASSPYRAVGIYIGGTNAACLGGNLNAGWVTAVGGMGWHMIPIYVGLQAPCANQTGMTSINASQAASQGTQNADDAIGDAGALGIGPGDPIFFDMEAYQSSCAPTVLTFLSARRPAPMPKAPSAGRSTGVTVKRDSALLVRRSHNTS